MVQPLFDVPISTDFAYTIPVIIPVSYQRQYLLFGSEITWNQIEGGDLPIYMPMVESCTKLRDECLELQSSSGESKYLLRGVHRISRAISNTFLQKDGILMRNGRKAMDVFTVLMLKCTHKVLESLKQQSPSRIEELSE